MPRPKIDDDGYDAKITARIRSADKERLMAKMRTNHPSEAVRKLVELFVSDDDGGLDGQLPS